MAIAYNVPVTFGSSGSARSLNCVGIDFSEAGKQSWTSASVAELDIQLPPARQDVLVQIEVAPFIIPDVLLAQQLFIYLGGLFIGYCTLKAPEVRTFVVNRGILTGRLTRMTLVLPNATSPSESYLSEDMRQLGVYLDSIVFKTSP
jgi:hypothetical protein